MTPPPFDADAYANVNRRNVPVPMLYLVTLVHPELPGGVLRLVRNNEPITSRGDLYQPTRMKIKTAARTAQRPPSASLLLDDVDKTALDAIRAVHEPPPIVTVEVVLANKPDVVQHALRKTEMRHVPYDAISIEGELSFPQVVQIAFPGRTYNESTAPAVFSAVER